MKRTITFLIIHTFLLLPLLATAQSNFKKNYDKGMANYGNGLYYKAITNFKDAEAQATKVFEKNRVYKGLADSYKAVSDNVHALVCYEKLEPIYRGENLNALLLNMSDLWLQTGQFSKVIERLEGMKTATFESLRLNNLSVAYLRLGQYEKAVKFFDAVIAKKDTLTYATAMQNKGYALWSMGRFDEALPLLDSASRLYRPTSPVKYMCIGNLAKVCSETGDFTRAISLIDNAIQWQKDNYGEHDADYIISLRKKAEILLAKGDTSVAARQFKVFFGHERDYIAQNFSYMSENERINYWHTQKPLIDECFKIEDADPDFLFDVAVFSKSVLTHANMNFARISSSNKRLSPLYDSLLVIRNSIRMASSPVERKKLEAKATLVERQLMENMPGLKSFVNTLKVSGEDIRKKLKTSNDIVVEFIYYPKGDKMQYAALVMQKNKPVRFVPMFLSSEIEDFKLASGEWTVQDCVNEQRIPRYKSALYSDSAFAHFVWDKILALIPQKSNLYFVPDGLFHSLAIEYLPCGRPDIKYYRLSSSRVLVDGNSRSGNGGFLLVGGLRYDDITSAAVYSDTVPNRLGSDIFDGDVRWKYLFSSRKEVDSVSKMLNVKDVQVVTGSDGTEDFLKRNLGKYSTALLSTHGYFRAENGLRVENSYSLADNVTEDYSMSLCGIVSAGANIAARKEHQNMEDGLLTALEISEMDLSKMDLIVLSACQTSLGRTTRYGTFNLPRGLKKAGAHSLLVSLWEVNDAATQKLMMFFFKNMAAGQSKYDALNNAQRELRDYYGQFRTTLFSPANLSTKSVVSQKRMFDNPYFWAPFVLIDAI